MICHVRAYSFLYLYLAYNIPMTAGKHVCWYVKYLPSLIRNVQLDCKVALLVVKCNTIREYTGPWTVGVRTDIVICVIQFALQWIMLIFFCKINIRTDILYC
jgi:hypothetical protein